MQSFEFQLAKLCSKLEIPVSLYEKAQKILSVLIKANDVPLTFHQFSNMYINDLFSKVDVQNASSKMDISNVPLHSHTDQSHLTKKLHGDHRAFSLLNREEEEEEEGEDEGEEEEEEVAKWETAERNIYRSDMLVLHGDWLCACIIAAIIKENSSNSSPNIGISFLLLLRAANARFSLSLSLSLSSSSSSSLFSRENAR